MGVLLFAQLKINVSDPVDLDGLQLSITKDQLEKITIDAIKSKL